MALVRAITTFHAPGNITVPEGALLDDSEGVARDYPTMFQSVEEFAGVSQRAMESVTARPGEKRGAKK